MVIKYSGGDPLMSLKGVYDDVYCHLHLYLDKKSLIWSIVPINSSYKTTI